MYYAETINNNSCGICLFKVWEQDFCTASMVLYMSFEICMKQVTNILYEKVGHIGFESYSSVKARKQGSINKGKCKSPIFSTQIT